MKETKRTARLFVIQIVGLSLLLLSAAQARSEETGRLTGTVMTKSGVPLAGGTIYLFSESSGPPPSVTKYWRVPDEAFPIEDTGRFAAKVPEGRYFLGAIKKSFPEQLGPPQDGDLFFISQDDTGLPHIHAVKKGEQADIGVVREAVPFSRSSIVKEGITSFEGMVTDADGKPLEGALVFGFLSESMIGRPLYVSDRTGKDGRYLLRLAQGGTYYLRVRSHYGGGPPVEGEIMGVYGERAAMSIKTGESKKNVDIKTSKFPGRGPKKETK